MTNATSNACTSSGEHVSSVDLYRNSIHQQPGDAQ
jgi:hypothetical protein